MQAFIIHFFDKSAESEYTINRLRQDLRCIDFDEYHFHSTSTYGNSLWKEKSKRQIESSDIVLFLYKDEDYNPDTADKNVCECIIAKNRHGETGKVELRWMPEYTSFQTMENRYDEE